MNNETKNEIVRHSFAHILAQAVVRLYPNTKIGIGPATKNGFYYDFEIEKRLDHIDLVHIEEEMIEIIKSQLPIKQIIISKDQAYNTLLQLGQLYKTELLQMIPDETVSLYKTGEDFIDLCRGPHVKHTGQLKYFKLTNISLHHWLNDTKRPLFQRIEGIAFATKADYESYFHRIQELKERNHLILGQKFKYFFFDKLDTNPIWLTKGIVFNQSLRQFIFDMLGENNYQFISSISVSKEHKLSQNYFLKNTLYSNHDKYFNCQRRSYNSLPIKLAEFENLFTEVGGKSKAKNLYSNKEVTVAAGSIYTSNKNLKEDIIESINIIHNSLQFLNLGNYFIKLVLTEEQASDPSVQIFTEVLKELQVKIRVLKNKTPSLSPELSFFVRDQYEREWVFSSIHLILENSKTKYVSSKSDLVPANIIRLRIIDSFEKVLAILLEKTGGAMPLWLSPVQVTLLSISKKYNESVKKVQELFLNQDIRASIDIENKTVQSKIRKAQLEQVPYMLIIGEKEITTNSVSVRLRSGSDQGLVKIDDFLKQVKFEIKSKVIDIDNKV